MKKITVINHPLVSHKLAIIRDKKTTTKEFKESVKELSVLLTYEITRDLKTKEIKVETPITKTKVNVISQPVVIVPILRAGLGMVDGITDVIPTAKVGHIGLYRDGKTLKPHTYYAKFPPKLDKALVLLLDPMLATGGSASQAINILKEKGAKHIKFVGIVGCPEGLNKLQSDHPDVEIYLAAKDSHLNELGYIVPGLGDCGDRLFGTK